MAEPTTAPPVNPPFPFDGFIRLDTWAGRMHIPVQVIGQTITRYRVKLKEDATLPGRRTRKAGDEVLVPKYAIGVDAVIGVGVK